MHQRNLSMLVDFYQFSMAQGYFQNGFQDKIVYFDMFFRKIPGDGGYVIVAGLEQLINYIENLHFTKNDIELLRSKGIVDKGFLDYLRNFRFRGDIYAMPEGTVAFPHEPMVTVRAPIIDAQLIETMVLLTLNHQSLIATKASRIVMAAQDRTVLEFGARRAQGADAAIYGARAAYIGGVAGTSTVLAEKMFGVPSLGTMAHSWVQLADSEYEAFCSYARKNPENCVLLVDTYDTLLSGVPNAIKVFTEVLLPLGHRPKGIRLDSGDLAYLSKAARKMLDEAGFEDCKIIASNGLNETVILSLIQQGAKIDIFGVGENLITSRSAPVFGGVYKLAGVEEDGEIVPRIKISNDIAKISNPSFKKTIRFYDRTSQKAIVDLIMLKEEEVPQEKYTISHPQYHWRSRILDNFTTRELQVPVFMGGNLVYTPPKLEEIRRYAATEVASLPEEICRLVNPHIHLVDLSQKLKEMKRELLKSEKMY